MWRRNVRKPLGLHDATDSDTGTRYVANADKLGS
jgi:hypothetical protein